MVAHCLYRTVFVVGAVLARLEQFLLGWSSSCSVGVTSCLVGALLAWLVSLLARLVHLRQVHPLKVHPLRLLLDVPAYC